MSTIARWVIASHNLGKIAEIKALLADLPVELLSQADFGISDVAETASTFVGNALLKAHYVSERTGLPTLADDSGLEVAALNGAPGIYSARYAGEPVNFQKNINKVLSEMKEVRERAACFRSVCVFLKHPQDSSPIISEGVWRGEIIENPRGSEGFGYDPIFYVPDLGCTAAELSFAVKNRVSHRGQAMSQLRQALTSLLAE